MEETTTKFIDTFDHTKEPVHQIKKNISFFLFHREEFCVIQMKKKLNIKSKSFVYVSTSKYQTDEMKWNQYTDLLRCERCVSEYSNLNVNLSAHSHTNRNRSSRLSIGQLDFVFFFCYCCCCCCRECALLCICYTSICVIIYLKSDHRRRHRQ